MIGFVEGNVSFVSNMFIFFSFLELYHLNSLELRKLQLVQNAAAKVLARTYCADYNYLSAVK